MATSRYRSTPQTTNAARVSRVVLGPCTDLFRDVLRQYIPEVDLPTKLSRFQNIVKPLVKGPQRAMLYPLNAVCTAKYDDFDISLLYLLIRNMCGIAPHSNGWGISPNPNDRSISANIDRIREIRNKYCGHSPLISLSNPEFSQIWTEVRQIVQEIEFQLFGPSTKFSNEVDFLARETMDPEQETLYLESIDKQSKQLDKIIGVQTKHSESLCQHDQTLRKHRKSLIKHEKTLINQGTALQYLKSSVSGLSRQARKNIGKQRRLEVTQSAQGKKLCLMRMEISQSDNEALNIKVNTSKVLKSHSLSPTYVQTAVVDIAIKRLHNHHVLILTGKGGEGKTTISREIMCRLSAGRTPVIIDNPGQWHKVVNADDKIIVCLDDVVGQMNLDVLKVESWKSIFDIVLSSAEEGNVFVIISIRYGILKQLRTKCPEQLLFKEEFEVNLSLKDYSLSDEERKMMIDKYEMKYKYKASELEGEIFECHVQNYGRENVYKLNDNEKKSIVKSNPYFGFPQTCQLFFTKREFFQLGPGFFTRPNQTMFEDIDRMRKSSKYIEQVGYCILVYVLFYQQLDVNNICDEHFKEIANHIRLAEFIDQDVRDAAQELQGPYLTSSNIDSVYTFSHETVKEAIVLSFGQLSQEKVINQCSKSTLYELVRTEKYKKRLGEIVLIIQKRWYSVLVEKLFSISTDSEGNFSAWCFLSHPACYDADFVASIFSSLTSDVERERAYRSLFKEIPLFEKPELIGVILKLCSHDASLHPASDTRCGDFTERGRCCTRVLSQMHKYFDSHSYSGSSYLDEQQVSTRSDICYLLDQSCCYQNRQNVLTICRYINQLSNAEEYYCRNIWDDLGESKFTLLYYCFTNHWDDVISVISTVYEPSQSHICKLLKVFSVSSSKVGMLSLCQYINGLDNARDYYQQNIRDYLDCDIGFNALHHCIIRGWGDVVDLILTVHPQTKTNQNWTCLHLASFFGHFSIFQRLIGKQDCTTERTSEGYSILRTLLLGLRYTNNSGYCVFFLDVNETYKIYTFGIKTKAINYLKIFQYILFNYPSFIHDLRLPLDKYGNTVAHYVVMRNQGKMFDMLIEKHPDIFCHHNNTNLPTAMHIAAYLGRHDMVKRLSIVTKDVINKGRGEQSLLFAMMLGLRYTSVECTRYIDVVEKTKLALSASLNEGNYIETLQWILSENPSLIQDTHLSLDKYGNKLIHYLVIHNQEIILDILLQKNLNMIYDSNETELKTALHLAVYLGRYNLVRKLWDVYDTENRTIEGYSMLHTLMLGLRHANGCSMSFINVNKTFMKIVTTPSNEDQYQEILHHILSKDLCCISDINLPLDMYGNNVIYYLIINNKTTILEALLECFSNIDLDRNDKELPTALHVAAYLGRYNMVRKLWDLVKKEKKTGGSSLMHALMRGLTYDENSFYFLGEIEENSFTDGICSCSSESSYKNIMEFLLSSDPSFIDDISVHLDEYGNNVVHYLVVHEREMLFDMLLQRCPNIIHHRNKTRLPTSLHVAVYLGRYGLVKKLWKAGVRPTSDDVSLEDTLTDGSHLIEGSFRTNYQPAKIYPFLENGNFVLSENSRRIRDAGNECDTFTDNETSHVSNSDACNVVYLSDSDGGDVSDSDDEDSSSDIEICCSWTDLNDKGVKYDIKLLIVDDTHVHWGSRDDFYLTRCLLKDMK